MAIAFGAFYRDHDTLLLLTLPLCPVVDGPDSSSSPHLLHVVPEIPSSRGVARAISSLPDRPKLDTTQHTLQYGIQPTLLFPVQRSGLTCNFLVPALGN